MHRSQNGSSNFYASHRCTSRLRHFVLRESADQFRGDSAPAAITSGTEGADLKSLQQRKGPTWVHCALAVHEIHFLIGRFAGEMQVGDRSPVPKGLGLARPFETAIKPVPWRAWASGRWTMQQESSDLVLPHLDHSATDQLFAENAYPPVVERVPFAVTITLLQGNQLVL